MEPAGPTTYYEVLGVPRDATEAELRHAYLAKVAQLRPERFAEAPVEVTAALDRASALMDEAWRTLGDPGLRAEYDRDLEAGVDSRLRRAERVWALERQLGWTLSPAYGLEPPKAPPGQASLRPAHAERPHPESEGAGLAGGASVPTDRGDVSPAFASLEVLADWLGPHRRLPKTVTVPRVEGMRASEAFYAVAQADLEINFVRLTENPTGGDGLVVDQDPPPGTLVRRHSRLTVHVVHPASETGISLS
jgi:curved DNA-binding protein CbpA